MNVSEVKVSGKTLRRSSRFAAMVSLFLASTILVIAQTSIPSTSVQAVAANTGDQGGSQTAGVPLEGTVTDSKGGLIPKATVVVRNEATGRARTSTADAAGHFSITGLPIGSYTVDASAPGFAPATRKGVQVAADHADTVVFTLQIGSATADVTVEADATGSVAASLAPMDALLAETSARTEITSAMIQNFMSPVADFGEAVEMAPGTFTTNGNGVGLGQSATYFRGFADGDYDIDFDGIPFYDTNTPTHHSWAFFPAQFLGGIDFDRSPGTASTIGPTPFGGSIHLLSKDLQPLQNIRGEFSGGSFHTYLYDGEYDSGPIGPDHRLNMSIDVHHMQSDGYQTYNYQTRNAGAIKVQYKLSDKTILTGFSGVIWLDANSPNFAATRCQMYGALTGYTCTGTLAPFAGAGINFLLTNNSDPVNYLDDRYNYYHVPTDFEYVGLHTEFGHNFVLDVKPYTYNYDNSEKYSKATPITEATTIDGSTTYAPLDIKIAPCNVDVTKKGITALPCGVDKYNSYRKYGETSELTQTSHFGTFRAGFWYEWARTSRHQFPSDPLNHWADDVLPNFNEIYWTNSYQPYAEYEFHVTPKLNITAGTKFAYYTIDLQQFADNGTKIGDLCNTLVTPTVCVPFVTNHGSYKAWLPSIDANYRIKTNWSAYGQLSTGSVVPPSSVYDYNQTISPTNPSPAIGVPPKQQRSTTYQFGSVVKLRRVTLDADFYHIRFQNSYNSVLDPTDGEQLNFLQPSSITKGFEAESNIYIGHGLSAYLNATVGRATYTGTFTEYSTAYPNNPLVVPVPSGLYVTNAPKDTETEGVFYQKSAWDVGILNKRVGTFYQDNGAYHNQATIDPFSLTNAFLNYTIRNGSRFDQTKIRLSFNNLFNEHNVTGLTLSNSANTITDTVNGLPYVDAFNTTGQTTISGADNVSILPGRSIMLSVIFGFSPHSH